MLHRHEDTIRAAALQVAPSSIVLQVLVVEDDVLVAMALQMMLSDEGFRVMGPAGSVATALALVRVEEPDVAVLDYNLGKELVTPVAQRLREIGVPFILASAHEFSDIEDEAFNGIQNVGKPTPPAKLFAALRALAR